ncbi:DEAD/DEAH box helicase [Geobacter sp. DSM 9736]|uniref:DEAD/DEAH box helicase n=1 Tax=Geobacter sp. DSM 9736 TaxID=1277350 RepID=UPI000B508934|nr:DEAD/DEAH box helicase [Geobacter sp. DSM 9736]SNB45174.1 Superfamily II DNA and RNA helicase [Geobacter sp. DSM 9736]
MTFAELELAPKILKAVEACGYNQPTPIQEQAIPLALAGRDLVATAQTGTGKTAAFVLPALQRLAAPSPVRSRGPRILVLTPTRELAGQVTDAVKTYGRLMQVRCGVILGGMPYREQLQLLSRPVDIIVATPGRLIDHLDRGKLDLSRVEALVLDEADRMLDMGFSEDVDRIAAALPAGRQTLMFTATLDRETLRLAARLLNDPQRVEIAPEQVTHDHIEQRLHLADDLSHKQRLLRHLIGDGEVRKAIIFSATKRDADSLALALKEEGHSAAALHGDMNQRARNRTIDAMKRGKIRLLVATDVAARGLDVSGISHVINYDLPKFAEDYVHRIGRTGRAGASGVAISFASLNELNYLDRIEKYLGQKLPEQRIAGLEPVRSFPRPGNRGSSGRFSTSEKRHSGYGSSSRKNDAAPAGKNRKWGKPKAANAPVVVYRHGARQGSQAS